MQEGVPVSIGIIIGAAILGALLGGSILIGMVVMALFNGA